MELTFGTGFRCPKCGKESTYVTGFWSGFLTGYFMDTCLDRLNREGGELTGQCGHTWKVKPGTRSNGKCK